MSLRLRLQNHAAAASIAGLTLCLALPASAQPAGAVQADEPMPSFEAAYMSQPANIKAGETVWATQCRHCHGNSAYPGKAPKLNPGALAPDFIFDRVTYGFRAMPAWRNVFTPEQRKAVVAYIKSPGFSP